MPSTLVALFLCGLAVTLNAPVLHARRVSLRPFGEATAAPTEPDDPHSRARTGGVALNESDGDRRRRVALRTA